MIDLKQIQTLRETKGKEQETLELISQALPEAQAAGDYNLMVVLNWEASLVYQHMVMSATPNSAPEALVKMAEHANTAHQIITENNLDKLAISHRFLGRVADYSGNYNEAITHYIKSLELLPADSHSRLELSGLLAYSTAMAGDVEKGMQFARKTYSSYFDTDLGKSLKEKDYYVWAVWMTGIAPRMLKALQETGASYDKEEMEKWLEEGKNELENPSGNVTWGDNKFQFRIDELNNSLSSLK